MFLNCWARKTIFHERRPICYIAMQDSGRLVHSYSILVGESSRKTVIAYLWKLRERKISLVSKCRSRFTPYNANISADRLTNSVRWSHCWRLSIPAKWTGQVNALRCLTDFTRIWISLDICSRLSNTKWPPSRFVYKCSIVGLLDCALTNQITSFELAPFGG